MITAFCKECGKKMTCILHYEEGISNTYFWCKICHYATKPKKIIYEKNQNENDRKIKDIKKPVRRKNNALQSQNRNK